MIFGKLPVASAEESSPKPKDRTNRRGANERVRNGAYRHTGARLPEIARMHTPYARVHDARPVTKRSLARQPRRLSLDCCPGVTPDVIDTAQIAFRRRIQAFRHRVGTIYAACLTATRHFQACNRNSPTI